MNENSITVEVLVKADKAVAWERWNEPEHITHWAFATDTWECPRAENNLRVGGRFTTRMQAKDGSTGFDFGGIYTAVKEGEFIQYTMDDGRECRIEFTETPDGVAITETFEPDSVYPREKQKEGWQNILDNFKKYAESV